MTTQLGLENAKAKPPQGWLHRMAASLGFASTPSLRETLESAIAGTDSEDDASISPQERAMLLNLLSFGETRVGEVMIPRADIVAIEANQPVTALFNLFAKAGHSRVPVFRENLDGAIGMVHIKDAMVWATMHGALSAAMAGGNVEKAVSRMEFNCIDLDTNISDAGLVREVLFVPPSMPALTLLAKMRAKQIHQALIVDEFGGIDGLATFEDLVEEIIGDIDDEHDQRELPPIGVEDEAIVASARTPIEDMEQMLGVQLTSGGVTEEVDTLGGLILAMNGSMPKRGQVITHPAGVSFEIVDASPRRLHTVRIARQKMLPAAEDRLLLPAPDTDPGIAIPVSRDTAKPLPDARAA